MLLTNGDILDVNISKIEQYGILVEYNSLEGLVLVPNISWEIYGIQERMFEEFVIGQSIRVKVLDSNVRPFNASIKDAEPEKDPWSNINDFQVDSICTGVIVTEVDFGYFVEIKKGVRALLMKDKLTDVLQTGSNVKVKIISADMAKRKIEVTLICKV